MGKRNQEVYSPLRSVSRRSERKYLQRVGDGEDVVEKDGILVDRHKPEHPSEAKQRQQHNRHLHTAPARETERKDK